MCLKTIRPYRKIFLRGLVLGPDKWASIWLVHRYLNPGVRVAIFPENTEPEDCLLFDIPESAYFRDTQQTTFEKLQQAYGGDAQTLGQMAGIVNDLEVNMWFPDKEPLSSVLENSCRLMREKYDRIRVLLHSGTWC